MKVAILAGGYGTRLLEETTIKPKPMVRIGDEPILWHIMKHYSYFGYNEFIIALGFKGEVIKDYFLSYHYHKHSLTIDLSSNDVKINNGVNDPWIVHLLDTGLKTMTGGRIKQVSEYIGDETFMLTYGDGVSNVNIRKLLETHKESNKLATITAVHPASRYGELKFQGKEVNAFTEKPQIGEGWINGGYFVLEPEVTKYIEGSHISWEQEPLNKIVKDKQLSVYKHEGYWQCMDSLRDVQTLNSLWESGNATWKVW